MEEAVVGTALTTDIAHGLSVKALPSVSYHAFTLMIRSTETAPVHIRILDEKGRLLEARSHTAANGMVRIGDNYRPDVYYAEVVQGAEKKVMKLINQ